MYDCPRRDPGEIKTDGGSDERTTRSRREGELFHFAVNADTLFFPGLRYAKARRATLLIAETQDTTATRPTRCLISAARDHNGAKRDRSSTSHTLSDQRARAPRVRRCPSERRSPGASAYLLTSEFILLREFIPYLSYTSSPRVSRGG